MSKALPRLTAEIPAPDFTPVQVSDDRVRRLKTPKDCQIFMKNVSERGRPDLARQARRHAIDLRTEQNEPKTPLERAWFEALHACEEAQAERDGGPVKASRTRQLLKKHGVRGAIERAMAADGESSAYEMLRSLGLQELAFENAVLRFPEEFSPEVMQRAKANLAAWPA